MRLGSPLGIPVSLHPLFLLGAAVALLWQLLSAGPPAAGATALLGLGVFGSVFLHELGHALAAKGFGIHTRSITLHPLGGLATLDRAPNTPTEEVMVALAGPAVNVLLAGLSVGLWAAGLPDAAWLAFINVGMGLFNLLPAFPMDGGRVLRAALASRMPRPDATRLALTVARGFGWLFIAAALFGGWNLALIGGFILLSGNLERTRLSAPPVRHRVSPHTRSLFAHPTT